MDHLRSVLGEDAFCAGLRYYTRQHAGGAVTSIDFERSMEKATGRDLTAEFAALDRQTLPLLASHIHSTT